MRLSVSSKDRESTLKYIKDTTGFSNKEMAKYAETKDPNMRQYRCGRKKMPKGMLVRLFFNIKEAGYLTKDTLGH